MPRLDFQRFSIEPQILKRDRFRRNVTIHKFTPVAEGYLIPKYRRCQVCNKFRDANSHGV